MPEDPNFDWNKFNKVKWWWFNITVLRWLMREKMSKEDKKGHGYPFPWWFFPVVVILRPFLWISDQFKRRKKNEKNV